MEAKPKHLICRICQYILDRSIKLYLPEQQSWGRAASAEVQIMPSTFSVVRWTCGAVWVALRVYLSRVLTRPSELFLGRDSLLRYSWRSMSPFFLALSLGLFLVPQFREALRTTTSMWIAGDPHPGIPDTTFHALEAVAQREHDARTLAFLAMRSQDKEESIRLAEQAVALDPDLTWILSVAGPPRSQISNPWLERLEHWDPDNAFPYVLHASILTLPAALSASRISEEMLTSNPEFRNLMARAFAAGHYDSYLDRRLDLDREVMRNHKVGDPLLLLAGLQFRGWLLSYAAYSAEAYANWRMADAETMVGRGNLQAAADQYKQVFWFGQKLEAGAVESSRGTRVQKMACAKLAAILLKQDKREEAATLNRAMLHLGSTLEPTPGIILTPAQVGPVDAPPPALSNPGLIMQTATETFVLALVLSVASFLSFRFRYAKDARPIPLPHLVAYAPLALFLAALVLVVSYLPYARIFEVYLATSSLAHGGSAVRLAELQRFTQLTNLQYPFNSLFRWNLSWLAIFGAPCIVFLGGIYSLVRLRVKPGGENLQVNAS